MQATLLYIPIIKRDERKFTCAVKVVKLILKLKQRTPLHSTLEPFRERSQLWNEFLREQNILSRSASHYKDKFDHHFYVGEWAAHEI